MGRSFLETRRPQHRTTTRRKGSRCCPMVRPLSQSDRSDSTETSLLNRTTRVRQLGSLACIWAEIIIGWAAVRTPNEYVQYAPDHRHLSTSLSVTITCVVSLSVNCSSQLGSSAALNSEFSCRCRPGDEHSLRDGDGPIRHDRPADVYPGGRDRSGDGPSGARK